MLIKIDDINVGDRFRRDLGDTIPLAKSIKKHGLLHPIVVARLPNERYQVVCGERRLAAVIDNDETEIEARILDIAENALREAEIDENNIRKNFTTGEIAEIDEYIRKREEDKAKERQKAGKRIEPSLNLSKGRAADNIAKLVGVSDSQLEKIRKSKALAIISPAKCGPIWNDMAKDKIKVHRGFKRIQRVWKTEQALKEARDNNANFHMNSNNKCKLMNGLFQEKMMEIENNSIALIFTDPPYDKASIPIYGELARLAERVLKPGGSLITLYGHYALPRIIKVIEDNSNLEYNWQLIVLHTKGHYSHMYDERIDVGYKPALWYFKADEIHTRPMMHDNIVDTIQSKLPDKSLDPWAQSPVEAEHVIKPLTVPGEIVLDPMMSTGTFGIATLQLKRKFIGIERNKERFEIAQGKLMKYVEDI